MNNHRVPDEQPETWPPPPLLKASDPDSFVPSTARPQFVPTDTMAQAWHRSVIARIGLSLLALGVLATAALTAIGHFH